MPQLLRFLTLCLKIGLGNEELGESWRHLALELVITTAETAPAMVRCVVIILVKWCRLASSSTTDIDEDEDWTTDDDPEEEDSDSNAVVAECALDRLACGLGGKTVFSLIMSYIHPLCCSLTGRLGTLLIDGYLLGEGRQDGTYLSQVMDGVYQSFRIHTPGFRYACCNAISSIGHRLCASI